MLHHTTKEVKFVENVFKYCISCYNRLFPGFMTVGANTRRPTDQFNIQKHKNVLETKYMRSKCAIMIQTIEFGESVMNYFQLLRMIQLGTVSLSPKLYDMIHQHHLHS